MITDVNALAAAIGGGADDIPITNQHRKDFNEFVGFLEKRKMNGHPDLDKNNLGTNLLTKYRKENPETTLTPDHIIPIQNDMSKLNPDEASVIDGLHSSITAKKYSDEHLKIEDPVTPPKHGFDMGAEMRDNAKKNLQFDDKSATEVVRSAAKKTGVDPALLLSSAWTEGMNKAVLKPDDIGGDYPEKGYEDFPVDGFYNYGLDTFGERYNSLKKYLPEGFDKRFKPYTAKNEKNEKVQSAAFRTNEDALIAKGAMIRQAQDEVTDYFKKKDVPLDDKTSQYFALATYNGGPGNAKKMMDEYISSADKENFVSKGLTSRQGVHKNISSRIKNMDIAAQLLQ